MVGYYVFLLIEVRRDPTRTIIGVAAARRREWVRSVMTDRRDILAVQTLRNWTMAASFLATTAVLIATGALHFLTTFPDEPALLHALNFLGSVTPAYITVKLFAIIASLLIAFFNYAVAIRYYNHVSIEINVPLSSAAQEETAAVQRLMDRAGLHFAIGMRCFYLAIPLALWLFGALWLLLGSIGLCISLFIMDHVR